MHEEYTRLFKFVRARESGREGKGGPGNLLTFAATYITKPVIGENRQLVTDEPVEFEK